MDKTLLVAEVKTTSPFGYTSTHTWDELFKLAAQFGNIISIHTDPRWGGKLDDIRKARALTDKPILAKQFSITDKDIDDAVEAGANHVLVVDRIPAKSLTEKCWLELGNFSRLKQAMWFRPNTTFVWNRRNLTTGNLNKAPYGEVLTMLTRCYDLPQLVQASGIKCVADIHPLAPAVLVGENLVQFCEELVAKGLAP